MCASTKPSGFVDELTEKNGRDVLDDVILSRVPDLLVARGIPRASITFHDGGPLAIPFSCKSTLLRSLGWHEDFEQEGKHTHTHTSAKCISAFFLIQKKHRVNSKKKQSPLSIIHFLPGFFGLLWGEGQGIHLFSDL